jgi:hypothetical protein
MSLSDKIIFVCLLLIPIFFMAVFAGIGLCLMY